MKNIVSLLTTGELVKLQTALTPKLTKYIPHQPTAKQAAFLLLDCKEAFYGGAAGGGKSDALLMAALQYVDVPGYNAILFRKTYADLTLPGALMDRAREWLQPYVDAKEVRWDEKEKTYKFPSGATLSFGYLEHPKDRFRYQGAEFQFIGFDEVTQIDENSYKYLFSRLRRLKGVDIPLRVRAASNPGGEGHEWVKKRFITDGKKHGRVFIPATMYDNPFLDIDEYEKALDELDPVTRAQLKEGNWDVRAEGNMFKSKWFDIIDEWQLPKYLKILRYWDLAGTDTKKSDWTAGVLQGVYRGIHYILDVERFRERPEKTEQRIKETAIRDGYSVPIYMEQEPGSSGLVTIDHYARFVLKGYSFKGVKSTGSKVLRAQPASAAAERGHIKLLRGYWNKEFLEELELFPGGLHDDQVDAFSGGYNILERAPMLEAVPIAVGGESYWSKAEVGGDYDAGY